jgi:hypothetical protein
MTMVDYVVIEDDPDSRMEEKKKRYESEGIAASNFVVLKVTSYRYCAEDVYGSDEVVASRGGIDFDANGTEQFTTGTFTHCAGLDSYPRLQEIARQMGLREDDETTIP